VLLLENLTHLQTFGAMKQPDRIDHIEFWAASQLAARQTHTLPRWPFLCLSFFAPAAMLSY
jgi:hypothetical protein